MSALWVILACGGAAVVVVLAVGAALPREHVVTRSVTVAAPAERVRALITDVARAPTWRSGLQRVDVTDATRFVEHSRFGPMAMLVDEDGPRRRVTRIADEAQGFGGTWTFELSDAPGAGTTLAITERGTVHNPAFRFLARFVFGHASTIEQYLRDLERAVQAKPP